MNDNNSAAQTPAQLNQELGNAMQQLNQFMAEHNLLDGAKGVLDMDLESNDNLQGETKQKLSQIMGLLKTLRDSDELQSELESSHS